MNLALYNKAEVLHEALVARLAAQRAEAIATLQVYYESATGIGEHPQVVEEMAKQLEKLAAAEDALSCLERNFTTKTGS